MRPRLALAAALVLAAGATAAAAEKKSPASMLPGTSSHDPISINAGRLDYFDKEQKLVYSGDVVAVQGDSTLKGSELTIYLAKDPKDQGKGQAPAAAGETAAAEAAGPGQSSVKHMDVKGPVTLISKDQVGTGDFGTYDKADNKVTLTGNVTLSQGTNVTKGNRLVYDLTSGQAQVTSGQSAPRVMSVFTPGSGTPGAPDAGSKKKSTPKPKAAGTASTQ